MYEEQNCITLHQVNTLECYSWVQKSRNQDWIHVPNPNPTLLLHSIVVHGLTEYSQSGLRL